MKTKILAVWTIVALCGVVLTSCMGDTDSDYTLSNTAMITGVKLGNVKRLVHTKDKEGNDSTYYSPYTASDYVFRIDQIANTITNPEPLLYTSKLDAVVVTVSAQGTVFWRKPTSDPNDEDWKFYSSTDSMDVSTPVELRVISYDGTQQRDYTLTVRSYKKAPDSLSWTLKADCQALAANVRQRAVVLDGHLVVMGVDASGQVTAVNPLDDATARVCTGAQDMDVTTLSRVANRLYAATTDRRLITSTDATEWSETGLKATALAGGDSRGQLYALDGDDVYTLSNAIETSLLTLDAPARWLPRTNVCGATYETKTRQVYHVMAGLRDAALGDTCAVVWVRRIGADVLMYYPFNNEKGFTLPALEDLHLFAHDGKLAAMGGASIYGATRKPLENIYISPDCGLTWNTRAAWTAPEALKGRTQPLAVATQDDKQPFYVVSGTQVWEVQSNALDAN